MCVIFLIVLNLHKHLSSFLIHLIRSIKPSSIRGRSRKSLMQMWRESVSQLTCVRGQVNAHLLETFNQHASRRLVTTELTMRQPLPLLGAADNGPHQQVGHVDGHRLRQAGEPGRVAADHGWIAVSIEWQDFQCSD